MKHCLAIVETATGWQVVKCNDEKSVVEIASSLEDLESWVREISDSLKSVGHVSDEVLFCISATSCVAGHIDLSGLTKQIDDHALSYMLEESIPYSAEEITADFIRSEKFALGVALETDQWLPVLERLEQEGIRVRILCPWTLISLQASLAEIDEGVDLIIQPDGDSVDLFHIKKKKVVSWFHLPADAELIEKQVQLLEFESGSSLNTSWLSPLVSVETSDFAASPVFEKFCSGCLELSRGKKTPLIQLRRGRLAATDPLRPIQTHLFVCLLSFTLLLLSVAGVLEYRAREYEKLAQQYQSSQEELFRQILPDQAVPVGIRSRLESELASLEGESGMATTSPKRTSAIKTLVKGLEGFPEKQRYRLDTVRIQGPEIAVVGEFLSTRGAVEFSQGLSTHGFKISSPTTTQTEQGFLMNLSTSLSDLEIEEGVAR